MEYSLWSTDVWKAGEWFFPSFRCKKFDGYLQNERCLGDQEKFRAYSFDRRENYSSPYAVWNAPISGQIEGRKTNQFCLRIRPPSLGCQMVMFLGRIWVTSDEIDWSLVIFFDTIPYYMLRGSFFCESRENALNYLPHPKFRHWACGFHEYDRKQDEKSVSDLNLTPDDSIIRSMTIFLQLSFVKYCYFTLDEWKFYR